MLNIFLGIVLAIFSFYYWSKVGGWRAFIAGLIGLYVAGIYLFRGWGIPEVLSHEQFGVFFVRSGFTAILILMTAKAVAAGKRVR
jgi:hypothetical protein